MNYSFVEISSVPPTLTVREANELTRGIYVNPIQKNLDSVADKPNVVKIAKAPSWEPNQTEATIFYMTKEDAASEGLPDWFADRASFGRPDPAHEWANVFHLIQKRTVPAISVQEVFEDNSVDKLGILSILMGSRTLDIAELIAPFLSTKTNKPGRIQLVTEGALPEKIEQVVDLYKNMGYFVRTSDGITVLLQHNDFPVA